MIWIIVEISVLIMVIAAFILYRKTIRPLTIIGNGMNLLKEQDFSSRLGHVGQKDADKIVDIFNKMMGQLKQERLHLREQNHFLDLLITSSPMGVVILDFDEKIMQVNPSGYKIIRNTIADITIESLIGLQLHELSPLGIRLAALEKGTSQIIRLSDASIYKCSCSTFVESGFYHKFYLVEQMTQEVLRTEKKAYEKVIRTIAHEVNNSMAGIGSTLDTVRDIVELQEEEESSFDQKSSLSEILTTASARCTSLSRFITNYANVVKIPQPQMEKVSLNEFVKGRYRFFEILCSGKNIKIQLNIAPVTSVVAMDTVLMEQVLLNIVKNSIESIGDADGEIVISTLSGGYSSLSRGDSSMQGGILEIFDNGCGISSEVSDKIFTPFFSTKPNGQGIGLIFIREVLQKHNFRFSLQTTDDNRTCFRIQF